MIKARKAGRGGRENGDENKRTGLRTRKMARDTILTQRLMLQIIKAQPLFQIFVCYTGKK